MAVKLSLDLENATLADLARIVEAARAAGLNESTPIDVQDSVLTLAGSAGSSGFPASSGPRSTQEKPVNVDAALKFIAELLGDNRGRN